MRHPGAYACSPLGLLTSPSLFADNNVVSSASKGAHSPTQFVYGALGAVGNDQQLLVRPGDVVHVYDSMVSNSEEV